MATIRPHREVPHVAGRKGRPCPEARLALRQSPRSVRGNDGFHPRRTQGSADPTFTIQWATGNMNIVNLAVAGQR
jgi:hypothetical protein